MAEVRATILHIDDNEANRYIVSRTLQNAGFTVVEAATGTAGLAAAVQFQPDLVILDVRLPDLNGFEVCRQIKANPETTFIPVLHLSATFVQSQDKAEGLDSGADAYLAQPVEPIELVATVRSLLRIRRAEEAALSSARDWQITFDSINDSVCLLDQDGKTLRCNQAMMRLFCKPPHEIIGFAHHELMNAELGVREGSCFHRAKETNQRQALELQFKGRWFAKTLDPVLDDHGNFTGAVLILSDITDRKRTETLLQDQNDRLNRLMLSLQEQTEQAQQANRIKDEFLAVLSHELRSPLNPILGWAKLLQNGNLDAVRAQHALVTIERNAKLQSELIEDLLDVSRILQGKINLHVTPVDLTTTVKAALETVRLAAAAKAINLQLTIRDFGLETDDTATKIQSTKFQVSGDAARLQQVVWNLLSNAVKFTPAGGQVEVQLEQKDQQAQITVSDTGKGISADFLPYVFDYFRQADSTTTRKFGGLGLGLAIVRHLVELHGGTVEATSEGEGMGATFIVKLPLLRREGEGEKERGGETQLFNHSATQPLKGLQILVIDDEMDSREFVAFVLEQAGARVTSAATANEGFLALTRSLPDVLLSDIGMPDMDGYMLMRQVRTLSPKHGGQVKAIALTAYARDFDQQQALKSGFQVHVTKPVEPDMLVRTIIEIIQKNKADEL